MYLFNYTNNTLIATGVATDRASFLCLGEVTTDQASMNTGLQDGEGVGKSQEIILLLFQ
jgi:hypothetical protein